jgi:hypothetical protein
MSMFCCEICYDWSSKVRNTTQWWKIAEVDWHNLNGKDLPYFIAILTVLREVTDEIFNESLSTSKKHSLMTEDRRGFSLSANINCVFIPLGNERLEKWKYLNESIRVFRNGAAHFSDIRCMNPIHSGELMDPQDSFQDYYRYAPMPDLSKKKRETPDQYAMRLNGIHQFVNEVILNQIRTTYSTLDTTRINYELYHVERGPLIDHLHKKTVQLLTDVKVWDSYQDMIKR